MTAITRRDFKVRTADGVNIAIREVRGQAGGGVPMILMHGTRVPGISEYDLPVKDGSLAEDLARLGHICFIPDARGFGGSDRPAAMERPAHESKPLVRITEMTRDVDAAVDELRKVSGRDKVALFGWGVGGTCVLLYAAIHPEKVSHVILYNSPYGCDEPHRMGHGSEWEDPEKPGQFNYKKFGGYTYNHLNLLQAHWDQLIPIVDKDSWRDPAMFKAFDEALLNGDPTSATRNPPTYRSPNGMLEDLFHMAVGRKLFDASQVYCKVFIINPEFDTLMRPGDVKELQRDLVHADEVRVWQPKNATHYIILDRPERGRDDAIRRIVDFLKA